MRLSKTLYWVFFYVAMIVNKFDSESDSEDESESTTFLKELFIYSFLQGQSLYEKI